MATFAIWRAPVVSFDSNVVTSDWTGKGMSSREQSRTTTKESKKRVIDNKQWECIACCLSQLTFSERGLKKLVESFKAYEHALSEDSVMDYFRAIINKCKKFAKTEMKSSIEEFEEKLNKIHVERKEQDATTRNALAHQKKVGNLGGVVRAKKEAGDKATDEIDAEDETSEVINPSESAESGLTSTVLEHVENGLEVQSPKTSRRGVSRSKIKAGKQSRIREQNNSSPIQSTLRMNRSIVKYLRPINFYNDLIVYISEKKKKYNLTI
ncbi:hypothetical protein M5K25_024181 [Dendrobium thyrsiflorum]|uniref:Uncharacterized protein n=1 Tax=Dendrobium thyrsiflorum TaxID=117978 RepID=A0ABD0U1L6_DENTH